MSALDDTLKTLVDMLGGPKAAHDVFTAEGRDADAILNNA